MTKRSIYLLALLLPALAYADRDRLSGISFFSPRPQGNNGVLNIVGWHPHIHRYHADCCYHDVMLTVGYQRSTRPDRIAAVLFGTDEFSVSGSEVILRTENDILADHFGLSTDFHSTVRVDPSIQSAVTTLSWYWGLDGICHGWYLMAHLPLVWTKWGLQFCETIHANSKNTDFPAGYMDVDPTPVGARSLKQALAGGVKFGDMQEPIKYGKVSGQRTKGGLADVHLRLGWDFVNRQRGYAGLAGFVVIPTGNRPDSEFLFEPIVGNGRHWEVGATFSGRGLAWEADGEQELNFFVDISFSQLLKARQRRSFDLRKPTDCQGVECDDKRPNWASRYMLFKVFEDGNYADRLTPVINHTTLHCDVSIAFQMDAVFMFGYTCGNFLFDVGYNGWIRSKEKINICDTTCNPDPTFPRNSFALKGIQDAIGNNTQHCAMLVEPTLTGFAFSLAPPPTPPTVTPPAEIDQTRLADDDPPIFTSDALIDMRSAASSRVLTHKFFMHTGYTWCYCDDQVFVPFTGLGIEVEFEGINERGMERYSQNTLNQWRIWLQSGLRF